MRSLDGEEIPVSLAGNVHFDGHGAPEYISAIARDISESRRTAVELQQAKEARLKILDVMLATIPGPPAAAGMLCCFVRRRRRLVPGLGS